MWYAFFRIQMVCTIQLNLHLSILFTAPETKLLFRFTLVMAKFWHNYIQIISMKYFYSIKNEIISLHYSFYILQSISLYKNIQTLFMTQFHHVINISYRFR